jgi:hypothetical protein
MLSIQPKTGGNMIESNGAFIDLPSFGGMAILAGKTEVIAMWGLC